MKDLERLTVETIMQKCQHQGETSATRKSEPMDIEHMKMRPYKGFVIEPVIGGYNIVLYGKRNILYVAGPSGMSFTDDMKQARSFRDLQFCQDLIDECIHDHNEWVQTLGGKTVNDLNRLDIMRADQQNQQQQQQARQDHIRQQQSQM